MKKFVINLFTLDVIANANIIKTMNIGVLLYNGETPLQGTRYRFDKTGVAIRVPPNGYFIRDVLK